MVLEALGYWPFSHLTWLAALQFYYKCTYWSTLTKFHRSGSNNSQNYKQRTCIKLVDEELGKNKTRVRKSWWCQFTWTETNWITLIRILQLHSHTQLMATSFGFILSHYQALWVQELSVKNVIENQAMTSHSFTRKNHKILYEEGV